MVRFLPALIAACLCTGLAQAQTKPSSAKPPATTEKPSASAKPEAKPDSVEEAARTCVHNRLKALVAEDERGDIANDATLNACTNDLRAEFKAKKKSYCEAVAYTGWLVADENSKLNGVQGQPYEPNKAFLQSCAKSHSWEKQK